jgi:ribosome biogenesis GTPase
LTVLTGLSGVGKSSLLSAVRPDLALRTGRVNEHSGEGRHTTTQATLLRLDPETTVVDTPGIREFGLSGLRRPELIEFFPDIATLGDHCRFKNCTHTSEPDCAVQTGVQNGTLAASRYHSYQKIYETLPG